MELEITMQACSYSQISEEVHLKVCLRKKKALPSWGCLGDGVGCPLPCAVLTVFPSILLGLIPQDQSLSLSPLSGPLGRQS